MTRKRKIIVVVLLIIPIACFLRTVMYINASRSPYDIRAVNNKNYNMRSMHKEMAEAYEPLVKKYPEHTDLCYSLGWAYYKLGRYREANELINTYVKGNPYYPEYKTKYINNIRKAAENAL